MLNETYSVAIEVLLVTPVIVFVAFVVARTVDEAQRRGYSPISGAIWMIVRPSDYLVERLQGSYNNAGDAFAAALRLEELGEWEEAVALLKYSTKTWPEHTEYAKQCIRTIGYKQSLSG